MATSKLISDASLRATLSLPKTSFPMKFDAGLRELQHVERLTNDLYRRQLQQCDKPSGRPAFVLHDGPPYANGSLHMGHFLNKVVKDMVNRSKLIGGHRIVFKPGWDCHGLPIETKALSELAKSAKVDAETLRARSSAAEIRRVARQCAEGAIAEQAGDFKRWGVMGDWATSDRASRGNAYVTMDASYEATQLRVFKSMVERGFVHRALKPVYWSPSSTTALAEAELEYVDSHKSTSVYVAFPVDASCAHELSERHPTFQAIIWTTTPWTLPANVAIAVNPDFEYVLATASTSSRTYLFAHSRLAEVQQVLGEETLTVVERVSGRSLSGLRFFNPLRAHLPSAYSTGTSTLICASHVANDAGTGLVHTAPGHGHDDFDAISAYNSTLRHGEDKLPTLCPVDASGRYTAEVGPALAGQEVLSSGTKAVLALLSDTPYLLQQAVITHRYPYDWRSKRPIIIRATKQWFVAVGGLVEQCKDALAGVNMQPPLSRNRLRSMLGTRTEWCISRQRSWGVPIPSLFHRVTGEAVMTPALIEHIASVIEAKGTDAWWLSDPTEFMPLACLPPGTTPADYTLGGDTLDVWFDSGTSWSAAWAGGSDTSRTTGRTESSTSAGGSATSVVPSDLVVEGSDQHRGWFQSSLITSVAATGAAPYKAILTHGFVLDDQLRKMSKSLGNVIAPGDVIQGRKGGSGTPGTSATAGGGGGGGGGGDGGGGGKGSKAASKPGGSGGAYDTAHGVDVLRYWVAASDFTKDVVIGPQVVGTISEHVRKVRNTARFLLANLAGFQAPASSQPGLNTGRSTAFSENGGYTGTDALLAMWSATPTLTSASNSLLEQCMLNRIYGYAAEASAAYETFGFNRVINSTNAFVSADLSSHYFDFVKDRMYADLPAAAARVASQRVLWEALRALTVSIAPILSFTAESIFQHSGALLGLPVIANARAGVHAEIRSNSTVFDVTWPRSLFTPAENPELASTWITLLSLRASVNRVLEAARAAKEVGSANEAHLKLSFDPRGPLSAVLPRMLASGELTDLFTVSTVELQERAPSSSSASAAVSSSGVGTASVISYDVNAAFPYSTDACIEVGDRNAPGGVTQCQLGVAVQRAGGAKCKRCWKYSHSAAGHSAQVCSRCDNVLSTLNQWGT